MIAAELGRAADLVRGVLDITEYVVDAQCAGGQSCTIGTRASRVQIAPQRRWRTSMVDEQRPTGIPTLGHVPWGTHFCLFYETRADLLGLLIPYFKAGLENHEFCLCIASEPVIAEEAERALRQAVPDFQRYLDQGQIEIVSHLHWYFQ